LRICISDGAILFETGAVRRELGRSELLRAPIGRTAQEQLGNPEQEWRHIAIDPEPGVAVTLIYQSENLSEAMISFEVPARAGAEWSIEIEHERRGLHDEWLRSALGDPPYEYGWGSVVSVFDEKGLGSEIIVAYAR